MMTLATRFGGAAVRRAFSTGSVAYPYPVIRDTAAAALALAPQDRGLTAAAAAAAAIRFTAPSGGDARAGIVGWTTDAQGPLVPQKFIENRAFWAVALQVMAEHAHADPELQAQAAFQKTGWMNIADGRNPPSLGRTAAAEDILGCVLLEDRQIKRGSFQANDIHRPVTADGLFQLPQYLHARLVERLRG